MTQGEGKKILDFYYTHKRMPSYREIADLMGYASKNAAFSLVTKLIDAGFIQKDHTGKLIPTHLFSEVKLLGAVEAGFPSVAEEQLIDTMSIDDFLIEHRDASYVSLHTMRTTLFCIVMFVLAPWVAGASSYLSDTPPSVKDTIATHIDSFFTSLFSFSPKETYTKVGESFTKGVDTTLTNIPQALGVAIDSTTGELIYLLAQENTTQLGAASLSETAVSFFCFVNNTLGLNTCKEEETPVTPTPTPTTFVPVEERIKETTPPTPSTSAGQVPQKKTSSAPTPLPPQAPTRVVERVVTPEYITIEANNTDLLNRISFLESSLALLTTKLNTLPTQTATTFTGYGTYSSYQPPSTPVWGLTQKIDNLSVGVQIPSAVITNPTITGGSLSSVTLNNPTIVGYTATGTSTLSVLSGTTTLATQSPSSVLFTNASKQIATTPLFSFTGSNLGVGTTTPWSTLSVSGDASVTGSLFLASSTPLATTNRLYNNASSLYWNGALVAGATVGNWTLSGGNVYRATGNVGVGTTSPASKLYVTSDYQNAAFTPTGSKNKGIALDTGLAAGNGTYAHLGLTFNMDAGANQFSGIYGIHNNSSQTELAFVTTGTEKVRIDTNGNVGIGTTAPNQKLEVSGNALVTGYLRVGANSGGSGVAGDIVARRSSNTGAYYFGDSSSNYLYFDGTNYQFGNAGLYVKTDGNVGIGTSAPQEKLQIFKDGTPAEGSFGLSILSASLDSELALGASASGDYSYIQSFSDGVSWTNRPLTLQPNGGNVGIGTTGPTNKLTTYLATPGTAAARFINTGPALEFAHVNTNYLGAVGVMDSSGAPYLSLHSTGSATANTFKNDGSGVKGVALVHDNSSKLQVIWNGVATANADFSSTVTALTIQSDGNVGIGTTGPGSKLSVAGSAAFDLEDTAWTFDAGGNDRLGFVKKSGNYSWLVAASGAEITFGRSSASDLQGTAVASQTLTASMIINASGNVGIGTTTPTAKLDVYGIGRFVGASSNGFSIGSDAGYNRIDTAGSASQSFRFLTSGNSYAGINALAASLGTYAGTDAPGGGLIVSGNVGIGTTAPTSKLQVYQSGAITVVDPATYAFSVKQSGAYEFTFGNDASYAYIQSWGSRPLQINNQGNNTILNATSGNVGIGTTAPGAPLEIGTEGTNGIALSFTSGGDNVGLRGAATQLDVVTSNAGSWANIAANSFQQQQAVNNVFLGNVGIGTTSPGRKLSVEDTSGSNYANIKASTSGVAGLLFGDSDYDAQGQIRYDNATDSLALWTNNAEAMRVLSSGNVGIGTTSPWKKLSVEGGVAINGLTAAAGTPSALCLSASKEMVVNTGTSNCTVSSAQFKHDIETLTTEEAKRIVLGIEPVSFKYNGTNEPRLGFIAEQIETIEPRLVARDTDGSPRSVHYAEITAVLSAVVKEHQSNFDLLQSGSEPSWFVESVRRVLSQVTELTINIFTANVVYVKERLCIGDTCITESDLQELLLLREEGSQNGSTGDDSGGTEQDDTPEELPADTTAPIIIMQGNNPALLTVGESYADLGVVATDDSGIATIRTYYLGTEVTAVQIDTTDAMEHIITYVARDLTGNTATSTRTVIVSAGEGADEGPAEAPQP